jgi:uncharacterized protein (DUF2461 family)
LFYRDEIKKPAELDGRPFRRRPRPATGKPHVPKVFRIHRDVRFSKDKTPYNTHLHLLWSRRRGGERPAWFFGASPDYLTFGMGVMGLEKDTLTRFRQMIDDGRRRPDRRAGQGRDRGGRHAVGLGPRPAETRAETL